MRRESEERFVKRYRKREEAKETFFIIICQKNDKWEGRKKDLGLKE